VSGKARSLAADNAKPIGGRPIHCSRSAVCDENSPHQGLWDRYRTKRRLGDGYRLPA
jgi:hypothetical protein